MKKLINKQEKLEEPDYQMSGNTNMERLVNDLSRRSTEILLSRNGSEGQTGLLVNDLIRRTIGAINSDNISEHLPQLSNVEIAARATKIILEPLKKIDTKNIFGGTWNEQMATVAAQRLGLPESNIRSIISNSGPTSQKLRQTQADVSKESEAILKRNLEKNAPEEVRFMIQLETWLRSLIEELREELAKTRPELSKEQNGRIIVDTIWAFIQILNFAPKQDIPLPKLLKTLLGGRLGKAINIVDLHCLSFENSAKDGVVVCESAESTNGSVGHLERLTEIKWLIATLTSSSIAAKLSIVVVDNDNFVFEGQEGNINRFIASLEKIIRSLNLDCEILRASDIVDTSDFDQEWEKRNSSASTITEKFVDNTFEEVQRRSLPQQIKTRTLARTLAKKGFLVQFSLGATIPDLFEPSITLQNARAHQQATQIFRLGSGKASPIILTFWVEKGKDT